VPLGGFPYYYKRLVKGGVVFDCDYGYDAVVRMARYTGQYIASPGFSNHQDGLAIDFGTGSVGRNDFGAIGEHSWFHHWLVDNAGRYGYHAYVKETWHWTYRKPDRPSWSTTRRRPRLHHTLEFDTPIVVDLKAQASSPAERLQKIGERVGLPAHSRSDSYFYGADSMSLLPREIEIATFNGASAVPGLFTPINPPNPPNPFQVAVQQTITHWSVATGRDLRPVSVAPQSAGANPSRQVIPT
jgi:hypothetical protein